MKRRIFLFSLLGLSATTLLSRYRLYAQDAGGKVDNPYADVDWEHCKFVDSMSHQHASRTEEVYEDFYERGYRHLAFSNYYPSSPTYPLPDTFIAKHPDVAGCPNAEHHSFLDSPLHFCAPGSLLTTGYGHSLTAAGMAASPIVAKFEGLNVFNADDRPGNGVYRLDITVAKAKDATTDDTATLTVDGATECVLEPGFAVKGEVRERALEPKAYIIYFRANVPTMTVTLNYDKNQLSITQFRLMQGSNRPWREVFRAALDGETVGGQHTGGLQYADGGGITLNHPTGELAEYQAMLDFDPRVMGIEVWNVLTTGFGATGGFYDASPGPHLHFYQLWDQLLSSGRRCLGFFVKDHVTAGRGRNVLLVPDFAGRPMAEREQTALRAYRRGAFFGSVTALATDDAGNVVTPYDRSTFRFSRIELHRDAEGRPDALNVAVAGNAAEKRPNIQLRFVTDKGVELVADAATAEFRLPRDAAGRPTCKYVRVEAFAYPPTHKGGEPLTKEAFRAMNVYDISLLYDKLAKDGVIFAGNEQNFPVRIPIADMLFSQPIRFL